MQGYFCSVVSLIKAWVMDGLVTKENKTCVLPILFIPDYQKCQSRNLQALSHVGIFAASSMSDVSRDF